MLNEIITKNLIGAKIYPLSEESVNLFKHNLIETKGPKRPLILQT